VGTGCYDSNERCAGGIELKYRTLILPLLLHLLATACSSLPAPIETAAPTPPEETASVPAPQVVVARDPELEQKLARAELLLLEREAQVNELQARLDGARQEVVRALAKQQSLASRAEAASGMAEAEIALQSLRDTAGGPEVPEVSRLIALSSAEFEKQNYAGALYLASQAKSAAFAARGRLASVDSRSLRAGEVAFVGPLQLQTTRRANVRDGPGGSFRIMFTLPAGAPLTGHSHTEQWVRITDDSGREGWIYQNLIGRRP
jgi:Bacterial SH3 domain